MKTRIFVGDCFAWLKSMESDSVDCVVTSPPYWGLRDYGVAGQIGMEPTLGEHLGVMVSVFAQIHRVLKPSGTLWMNYGDCYATTPNGRSAADAKAAGNDDRTFRDKPFSTIGGVLKPKDLCMIPNRLAIALQEWGWWVRSEIIWAKPNPMPESIKDRPATAHEKIFLLTKSPKYFYNAEVVRRPMAASSDARLAQDVESQAGSLRANGGTREERPMRAVKAKGNAKTFRGGNYANGKLGERDSHGNEPNESGTRNLRNYEPAPVEVWEIATAAFSEAHFATFPPELARRCILAGCPTGGLVLDPFGGSGTVAMVADRLGCNADIIELNPEYVAIAENRIRADNPLFSGIEIVNRVD